MCTYFLCGFANFASIGIQIGGIGGLTPKNKPLLAQFGMRALLAGTLASLLSATVVGMIIGYRAFFVWIMLCTIPSFWATHLVRKNLTDNHSDNSSR